MLDLKKCSEIYDYCQIEGVRLKMNGHDNIVLKMASKEFGLSEATIHRAFDLIHKTMPKKDTVEGFKIKII